MTTKEFPRPFATVDVVILTIDGGRMLTAVMRRDVDPFAGSLALVGGFVHLEEDRSPEDAASRILRDKAGLEGIYLEQLETFAGPDRDPRGWSVSIAYLALVPIEELRSASGDRLVLVDPAAPGELAFDHARIVERALARLSGKGAYSVLPAHLLPDKFTIEELRSVYETISGSRIDKSSFRRKVTELDFLEDTGEMTPGGGRKGRVGRLYRLTDGPVTFRRSL